MNRGIETKDLIRKLKNANAYLCTVESCTGGMIADLITDVSGSSEVFWGAFVTYANSAKEQLGVPTDLIRKSGAVSSEAAEKLAEAGLRKLEEGMPGRRAFCISTTGIAGPTGGSAEKPVGLCYIGIAGSGMETRVRKIQSPPDSSREANKSYFTEQALSLILETL